MKKLSVVICYDTGAPALLNPCASMPAFDSSALLGKPSWPCMHAIEQYAPAPCRETGIIYAMRM